MASNLKARWLAFAGQSIASNQCEPIWHLLEAGYTESGRAYHNLEHIADCFSHFDPLTAHFARPDLVEMALWFHDVVYVIGSQTNEKDSAAFATEHLTAAGWHDQGRLANIEALIIDTEHKRPATTPDGALLCDIDLAILGCESDRFWRYEREIRAEYKIVPWEKYRSGRAQVLRSFLDRPRIYQTELFHERNDAAARQNLARSIERLDQDLSEEEFLK